MERLEEMKRNEIEANDENIKESIDNDLIGRNQYLVKSLEILNNIDGNFTIFLNGKWGTGKTFFVKQLIYVINNQSERKNFQYVKLKNLHLCYNFIPVYFNAWENDEDNHILALVSSIIKQYNNLDTSKKAKMISEAKNIAKTITENVISNKFGININLENFEKNLNNSTKSKNQELKDKMADFINKLAPNPKDKVVVFIDELDRCKPEFAIKLLESLKTFWNNEKIIFVYSVDVNELAASINGIYGNLFNSFEYLQKFYDLITEIPNYDINSYINNKTKKFNDRGIFNIVVSEMINVLAFTMRDCNKFFQYYDAIKKYESEQTYDVEFNYIKKLRKVENEVFLPLLIGIKVKSLEDYIEITNGNGFEKLNKILKQLDQTNSYLNAVINDQQEDCKNGYNQIEEFYNFFFKSGYKDAHQKVYNYNRNSLKSKLNFLNENFTYNDYKERGKNE